MLLTKSVPQGISEWQCQAHGRVAILSIDEIPLNKASAVAVRAESLTPCGEKSFSDSTPLEKQSKMWSGLSRLNTACNRASLSAAGKVAKKSSRRNTLVPLLWLISSRRRAQTKRVICSPVPHPIFFQLLQLLQELVL